MAISGVYSMIPSIAAVSRSVTNYFEGTVDKLGNMAGGRVATCVLATRTSGRGGCWRRWDGLWLVVWQRPLGAAGTAGRGSECAGSVWEEGRGA